MGKHDKPAGIRALAARSTALVVICRQCGKKLGGGFGKGGDVSLAKALKRDFDFGKGKRASVRLVETGCLDVCPKGAVVVVAGDRPGETLLILGGTATSDVAARLGLIALVPQTELACQPIVPTATSTVRQDRSMATKAKVADMAQPQYNVEYKEIQQFGTLKKMPLTLNDNARSSSVTALNQLLADTITIRDLYKKHHWQMSGATFYQLHLLLDKHHGEQAELVDTIAERIMSLGGISVAMAHDVAETTHIPRPAKGREDVPTQLARLLEAHEIILRQSHEGAGAADEVGDDGTNDLFVSEVIRTNELQVWFIAEHLAETTLVRDNK